VIAVAGGRDSVVIGEDQVLHQLRISVAAARADGRLDPVLEHLFMLGLRAGRRSRSWRTGPVPSLADVAVAEIERATGPISGREVLVVGAGTMGRLAVRTAIAAGASVSIANRSPDRVRQDPTTRGMVVGPLDPGPSAGRFAAAIVAIAGRGPSARRPSRRWPPGPRSSSTCRAGAVPAVLVERLGRRRRGGRSRPRRLPRARHRRSMVARPEVVEATTDEFRRWLDARGGRDAAATLAERAEVERQAELLALWRQLPDLDVGARAAIERMSRHLARRLLREPFERLGRDADGHHERAARDLFGL
jgi:glutamyl-tRNA reductase